MITGSPIDDDQLLADQWVEPVYLRFEHHNFTRQLVSGDRSGDEVTGVNAVRRCVRDVEPQIVAKLLAQEDWRPRLAAGWYAGLRGWQQFTDQLGTLLVAGEVCGANTAYAAALACFATDASAEHLCRFLERWLPQTDKSYD